MSEYSLKERLVARFLSRFPSIKRNAKNLYVELNFILNKKNYTHKFYQDIGDSTIHPCVNDASESFFGYYDKCPMNASGWVINHISNETTRLKRKIDSSLDIVLSNIYSDEIIKIDSSSAYTWQQGCRTQWLDDDLLMFNDYSRKENCWVSKVFSLSSRSIIKTFNYPVQDSFKRDFFVSLNYKRLHAVTEDYGYNNQGDANENEFENEIDGLFIIDFNSGESRLLHSLEEIACFNNHNVLESTFHTVNHVMINKAGTHLMFIHRYYENGIRKDRLLVSDFESLKVVADNEMVSHCCWYNDNTIYGYLRNNNKDGYYFIDLDTLKFSLNEEVYNLGLGDGHPHVFDDLIVFDTYPDRSRIQSLFIYDVKNKTIDKLLEVFQSPRYRESSRCDLHPRFSKDGTLIFFDSVYENKRKHYYIKLK